MESVSMAAGRPIRKVWSARRRPVRGVALVGLGLTWAAVAVAAVVLALVFAAALLAGVVLTAGFLVVGAIIMRGRRSVSQPDDGVIEAQNVGGHSWVAHGWSGRS
jgi:hypothetical protein